MTAAPRNGMASDNALRQTVGTLYGDPFSIVGGAASGVVVSVAAATVIHQPWIVAIALATALFAIARVVLLPFMDKWAMLDAGAAERAFSIGAWGFAALTGLMAGLAIRCQPGSGVETLLVTHAILYAVSVSARNAARPKVAIVQVALALLPVIVFAAISPQIPYRLLAAGLLFAIPALINISLNVSRILQDSIAAAETSAHLANKMRRLAHSDVLTGLLNRAGLDHHLRELVAAAGPEDRLALLWLDLDRFKEVNDTLGHGVGDLVLREVGARLRRVAPAGACIARFGGDEFIIACPAAHRPEVEALAVTLLDTICQPIESGKSGNERVEIAGSLGIALLPDDGQDLETAMQSADLALYHAKIDGRKQFRMFDAAMTRRLIRRREIEVDLRQALLRDELSVFFQPIFDLSTGRIRGFEALVRWFHPEKGELAPDEFVPVAEETGAIITLGNWITMQAAKVAANWPEDVTLAVNLSPLQIRAPGAALGIMNALREARLAPARLELEITETVLLDHSPHTEAFIAELAAAGVSFALDDFGTGYSSLGYLLKYPFSKIKVDRSFVSGVDAGEKSEAIIRAVSGIGRALNMEIVAEGIETAEQERAVTKAGCTLGQGYYYSRAVPDYLATAMLAHQRDDLPRSPPPLAHPPSARRKRA